VIEKTIKLLKLPEELIFGGGGITSPSAWTIFFLLTFYKHKIRQTQRSNSAARGTLSK